MAISVVAFLRQRLIPTKLIYVTALDGIINVNSLFSLALFLGLTTTGRNTAVGQLRRCDSTKLAERVVSSHVYSFSAFIFSSLMAMALKNSIRTITTRDVDGDVGVSRGVGRVSVTMLRVGIMLSGLGSGFGCGFLVRAMVDVVEIKLGTLGCERDLYSLAAIVPLVLLVPSALVVYVFLVLYAFTH